MKLETASVVYAAILYVSSVLVPFNAEFDYSALIDL